MHVYIYIYQYLHRALDRERNLLPHKVHVVMCVTIAALFVMAKCRHLMYFKMDSTVISHYKKELCIITNAYCNCTWRVFIAHRTSWVWWFHCESHNFKVFFMISWQDNWILELLTFSPFCQTSESTNSSLMIHFDWARVLHIHVSSSSKEQIWLPHSIKGVHLIYTALVWHAHEYFYMNEIHDQYEYWLSHGEFFLTLRGLPHEIQSCKFAIK